MSIYFKCCAGTDISAEDFHVKFLALKTSDQSYKSLGKRKFDNTTAGHNLYIEWLLDRTPENTKLIVVMEATGVYYEQLAYTLYQAGITVSVQLPNKIKLFIRSYNEHSKTDAIDAEAIARFGLQRKLREWEPFSENSRRLKLLSREYQQLEEKLTRVLGQLHASERAVGGSPKSVKRLKKEVAFFTSQKKAVLNEMDELCANDQELSRGVEVLTSIFGVGEKTAYSILAETDGFELFSTREQLIKYVGLDVVYRQSGTSVSGKQKISKRGNKYLRKALFFPAMRARERGIFKEVYDRYLKSSKQKMKALVAVQRKLLITMYALIKKDELYVEDYHKLSSLPIQQHEVLKEADQPESQPAVTAS